MSIGRRFWAKACWFQAEPSSSIRSLTAIVVALVLGQIGLRPIAPGIQQSCQISVDVPSPMCLIRTISRAFRPSRTARQVCEEFFLFLAVRESPWGEVFPFQHPSTQGVCIGHSLHPCLPSIAILKALTSLKPIPHDILGE
jgi:hypothetical protein